MDKLSLQSLISKISIATDEEYHLTEADRLAEREQEYELHRIMWE